MNGSNGSVKIQPQDMSGSIKESQDSEELQISKE
jgi:hypothetical protein